jgi:hypothetical protein
MFSLEEFRTGRQALWFTDAQELPACCWSCVYLLYGDGDGCLCDCAQFYFCGYTWPDKLTDVVPPCLAEQPLC